MEMELGRQNRKANLRSESHGCKRGERIGNGRTRKLEFGENGGLRRAKAWNGNGENWASKSSW